MILLALLIAAGPLYIKAGRLFDGLSESYKQNVTIHRCQVNGPNRLGVLLLPRHTLTFFQMAEEAGQPLDAAIQEAFRNNLLVRDVRGLIYENQLDPNLPQGWWWPLQIALLPAAGLQHIVANVPPPPATGTQIEYNVANIDVTATYPLDIWGNLASLRKAGLNLAEQQRQLVFPDGETGFLVEVHHAPEPDHAVVTLMALLAPGRPHVHSRPGRVIERGA